MVRISGIDLLRTKRIEYALTKIFGIGVISANEILTKAEINPNIRTHELTDENVSKIRELIEKDYQVESDLKRKVSLNIKRLAKINCVRGRRHHQHLPLRGQRTRTNARSSRDAKKTVASRNK